MKKILTAGILVVIIPLLGIPILWKTWFLIATGLYIIWQTFVYKKENNQDSREKDSERIFVENEENIQE